MVRKGAAGAILLVAAVLFLQAEVASAEERTVVGRIRLLDPAERTLTVTDAAGKGWNFRIDGNSGIDLSGLKVGDRIEVTIARGTPLNMMSAADLLKKGDRIRALGGY